MYSNGSRFRYNLSLQAFPKYLLKQGHLAPTDFQISLAIMWFSGRKLTDVFCFRIQFALWSPVRDFTLSCCVQSNDISVDKWHSCYLMTSSDVLFYYSYKASMQRRVLKGPKGFPSSKLWALYFPLSSVRPNWLQMPLPLAKLGFTLFPHRNKFLHLKGQVFI